MRGVLKVKSKVWLEKNSGLVFGDGKMRILEAVQKTGSINKASVLLGMSYRHVWGYISAAEKRLGLKLLEKERGGKDKGGSKLTAIANEMIKKYKTLNKDVKNYTDTRFRELFDDYLSI